MDSKGHILVDEVCLHTDITNSDFIFVLTFYQTEECTK